MGGQTEEANEFSAPTAERSSEEADLLADVANFFGTAESDDDAPTEGEVDAAPGEEDEDASTAGLETPSPDGKPQE
jgi:hypothetical protein